jgi:hypothetical protein
MGGLADDDAPWPRQLLQAGSQVGGIPHGRVVHAQVVANLADHDRTGVEADAHLQAEAALSLHLLAVFPQGALNSQGRMHRPPWAIVVGDRGPEQCHYAIAGVLVDRALQAVHLGGDPREAAVDDLVHDLGVELLGHGREARHIGEKDGDLATLPFQGAPGREDLLGEMLRGIRLGDLGPSRHRR